MDRMRVNNGLNSVRSANAKENEI